MNHEIATTAEAAEADVLPRRVEVHCDDAPGANTCPPPTALTERPQQDKSPAEWAYERLIMYIGEFESQLDGEHEVAMGFTGADAGILRIEGMGFFDPDIVTFYGSDPAGIHTQLIQHVSQLNVLLRALPKQAETEEARRIGFRLAQRLEDASRAADDQAT